MSRFRMFIENMIKSFFMIILFILLSTLFAGLLAESFGYQFIAGTRTYKNIHLLIAVFAAAFLSVFIVYKIPFFKRGGNKGSQNTNRFSKQSKRERNMKYDFSNDFIDDIPDDYIDDMSYDFVDDIPGKFVDNPSEDFTRKNSRTGKFSWKDFFIGSASINLIDPGKIWTIDKGKITYREGGLINEKSFVQIKIGEKNFYYDKKGIPYENITKVKQQGSSLHADEKIFDISTIKYALFGPLSLLLTGEDSKQGQSVGIEYQEYGQNYTLLLTGKSVPELVLALKRARGQ